MHNKLLTYGLLNNKLEHINNVANGIDCNCICSYCKEPLVAKNKGKKKEHHFAHLNTIECSKAYESALHLLAKEVFKEIAAIKVPDQILHIQTLDVPNVLVLGQVVYFDSIKVEELIKIDNSSIIADSIGISKERKIIIEFAYTHFVDDKKIAFLLKNNLECIEVNLSKCELDKDDIKQLLLNNDNENKTWINGIYELKKYEKKLQENKDSFNSFLINYLNQNFPFNLRFPPITQSYKRLYSSKEEYIIKEAVKNESKSHFDLTIDATYLPDNSTFIDIVGEILDLKNRLICLIKHKQKYILIEFVYLGGTSLLETKNWNCFKKIPSIVFHYKKDKIIPELLINFLEFEVENKLWVSNPKVVEIINNFQKRNTEKYEQYKQDSYIRVFNFKDFDSRIKLCPNRYNLLKPFKEETFYKHQDLKKIIDGSFWNTTIYGKVFNAKYIYIDFNKIMVYDGYNRADANELNLKNPSDFFYAGLQKISSVLRNECGNCEKCIYKIDKLFIDNKVNWICGFWKQKNIIKVHNNW